MLFMGYHPSKNFNKSNQFKIISSSFRSHKIVVFLRMLSYRDGTRVRFFPTSTVPALVLLEAPKQEQFWSEKVGKAAIIPLLPNWFWEHFHGRPSPSFTFLCWKIDGTNIWITSSKHAHFLDVGTQDSFVKHVWCGAWHTLEGLLTCARMPFV